MMMSPPDVFRCRYFAPLRRQRAIAAFHAADAYTFYTLMISLFSRLLRHAAAAESDDAARYAMFFACCCCYFRYAD